MLHPDSHDDWTRRCRTSTDSLLQVDPARYKVRSIPLDSAASISYIPERPWFRRMWDSVTQIRTADGNVTTSTKGGEVDLNLHDQHGKLTRVRLKNAVYAPSLTTFVSASEVAGAGNTKTVPIPE